MNTLIRRSLHLLTLTIILGMTIFPNSQLVRAIAEGPGEGGPVIVPVTVTINQAAGQADPTFASPVNFTVVFSVPVAGFVSGGITLGGTAGATTAVITGASNIYNVAVGGMTGSGTVTANVSAGAVFGGAFATPNSASTSTDNTVTYNLDNVAPTITNVSSTTANGTYGAGATIFITVSFSEVVNVNGIPQIRLETGDSDGIATYSSGSGTSTLTFSYTVAVGHTSADLNYNSVEAFSTPDASIRDAANNNANLNLPSLDSESSLGGNKNIVITGVAAPVLEDTGERTHLSDHNTGTTETNTDADTSNDDTQTDSESVDTGDTGDSEGAVLGTCTIRNDQDIIVTAMKTTTEQHLFLSDLNKTYGAKFSLKNPIQKVSVGTIDHCDAAVINTKLNAMTEGTAMPVFELAKNDIGLQLSFKNEVTFLRPVTVVVKAIGVTDWQKVRVTDASGTVLSAFHLSDSGDLSIQTNYLRTLTINTSATPFANELGVPETDIEYASIDEFVKRGIISGHPDHTYKADTTLKRSETGKLIALFMGLKSDSSKPGDQWYSANLRALNFTKIIKSLDPEILEQRANFLAMIAKAKGINISTLPACSTQTFSDVATNVWYCPVVQYAVAQHWLRETSGELKPSDDITRSWAGGVLDRAF